MGWNGALTQNSALGESITFTPDTSTTGAYTVSSFTAPRKGVYRFQLMGSGGAKGPATWASRNLTWRADGGVGGLTDGYLLLEKGQTVYVGAGGPCSAAFVSSVSGAKLSSVSKADLLFAAGGGGQGGTIGESYNNTGYNCIAGEGGDGGGASGLASAYSGAGGTQSVGGASKGEDSAFTLGGNGAYGTGGASSHSWSGAYEALGGRGGDGYYGGGAGGCFSRGDTTPYTARGMGGGGGSGYVKTKTLTVRNKTYTSTTAASGGAANGQNGSVKVTYHARAELPVRFDGAMIERLFFNGTEVSSLVFNGVKLFMRRWTRCLQ